jgi:non-specific serine/threonine protein kinase
VRSSTPLTLTLERDGVYVDVVEFDRLILSDAPDTLEKAVALYRGPLMEGCAEELFAVERAERERYGLRALSTLADRAVADGDTTAAIRLFRQTIALDPFHEAAYRGLMTALSAEGNHAAAAGVYRDFRLLLHHELNSRPGEETEAVAERIHARLKRAPGRPRPIGRTVPGMAGQLPIPLTNLIGRQREVEELKRSVESSRLVTVTGPGGIGKTRLAIAVGHMAAGAFELGARFIELPAVTDPERVAPLVAQTLAIRQEVHRPILDTLVETLGDQSVLIIIDNAEHLLASCAALAERLLTSCPQVHLLFTSRQSIGLTGERVVRVPSLPVPASDSMQAGSIQTDGELQPLLSFAGIALLVERVREWNAGFRLTHRNAAAIIAICGQLDGIPLAIELAAARLRTLSAEEVRAGLKNRFALLTSGSRASVPRHRTLKTLLDWSYDLLTPQEQELLQQLSVFAGGWTIESAQSVYAATSGLNADPEGIDSDGIDPDSEDGLPDVVDLLSSLADKSLVVVDTIADRARYRMLETIRQYAAQQLERSGKGEQIRRRHCDYFRALAERANRPENRATPTERFAALETDYENLRAALLWCRQSPGQNANDNQAEIACRMTLSLYRFWHRRGYLREGRYHVTQEVRAAARRGEGGMEASLLLREGALARLQGDVQGARSSLQRSHEQARTTGDGLTEARSLVLLGALALAEGDNAAAVDLLTRAYRVAVQGEFPAAQSDALIWLGDAARVRSDFVVAHRMYAEGLAVAQNIDDVWSKAIALSMMAELALAEGDTAEARSLATKAMAGYLEAGDRTYCVLLLDTLAGIALAEGKGERACMLVAAVDHLVEEFKIQMASPEQSAHDARTAAVRSLLPVATSEALYTSCASLTWEQIIQLARND